MNDANQTTLALEPALRHLAAHPEAKVSAVAIKFKTTEKILWAWLGRYNRSKKELSVHIIDNALAAERAAPAPKKEASPRVRQVIEKKSAVPEPVKVPPLTSDVGRWLDMQGAKITGRANSFLVEVTPMLAQAWLTLNTGNRNASKQKIRRFAASMKAGRWIQNGETVKFSISGRLLDGQSRLKAIVESNIPTVLELRAGLPDLAQESMDIGEQRKGTHTLEMMGEKNPGVIAPALKLIWLWEKGWFVKHPFGISVVMENFEMAPMLDRHPGLKSSAGWSVSIGFDIANLMPRSEGAFWHYIFGTIDPELRDLFFDALVAGLGLTKQAPVYHLRQRLLQSRITGAISDRIDRIQRGALFIKAWNATRAGEKLTQLVWRSNGPSAQAFPELEGYKAAK